MAPISLRRRTIERELGDELPGSYVIVAAPDHPLLIEGPDVLIGGEGTLVAVFMPKASERNGRERLSARFILSRLALPPQTRHVLLSEGPLDDAISQGVSHNFAAVLPWHRRREAAKIVKDKHFTGQRNLPAEITQFAWQRFSDVYQVTRVLKQRTARHRFGGKYEVARGREQMPALQRRAESDAFEDTPPRAVAIHSQFSEAAPGVTSTWFSPGTVKTRAVYEIVRRTTSSGFALDNGVPYPTNLETDGLAVVEQLPEYRGDPVKSVRAAAFAGWAFVDEHCQGKAQKIAKLLSERREKRRVR